MNAGGAKGRRNLWRTLLGTACVAASSTCAFDVYSGPPPATLVPPSTTPGAPNSGTKLRLPARVSLDRVATIHGVRQPLRAHLDQIDASETRTLKNGKTVTLQQVVDAFDALETKAHARLADAIRHKPMSEVTKARLAAAHADLTRERDQRRRMEAAGWQEAIARKAGTARAFHPTALSIPPGAPPRAPATGATSATGATPPAGASTPIFPTPSTAGTATPIGAARLVRLPQPTSEPAELAWQQSWGEPATAQITVSILAGDEFANTTLVAGTTGCAADATASVTYLYGQQQDLARVFVAATTTPTRFNGALRTYVLGQLVPDWSRDGTIDFPRLEASIATPAAGMPYPIIGPLAVNLSGQAVGTLDVTATIKPWPTPNSVGCQAMVTPTVAASLVGQATPQLSDLPAELVDLLTNAVNANVTGTLTLMSLSLPSSLGLSLAVDPQSSKPVSLTQSASVAFQAQMFNGEIVANLALDLGGWAETVAGIFGIEDGSYSYPIIQWGGETHTYPLINISNNVIPFRG